VNRPVCRWHRQACLQLSKSKPGGRQIATIVIPSKDYPTVCQSPCEKMLYTQLSLLHYFKTA
jgi:hypothetical protein